MKFRLVLFLAGIVSIAKAQLPSTDQIPAANGAIQVRAITHASVVLSWNSKTIYADPTGGADNYKGITPPDLILVTDIHGDHFDPKTLLAVKTPSTILVVPQAVADALPAEIPKDKVLVVKNGFIVSAAGLQVMAMPMYNLPETDDSRHPKGRGNGYVVTLGGKNIYLSGDTEDIPEMLALKNIDAAFLCMNLPYTMDINQAAKAVLAFQPKIVYPYHYRGQDTEAFKHLVTDGSKAIDVRLLAWYPPAK